MGIVQGSVTVQTNSSGNYTVQMPENDLDVIGFAPIGFDANPIYNAPPIVGVYIDASNIAYFPLPGNANYTLRKYSPVHVHVKGNVLNLYIPIVYGNCGLTIFYGIPDGSEIEYSTLKGVYASYTNTSTTANASGTINVTFPTGNVRIVGMFAIGLNAAYGQLSLITGTGRNLYIPIADSPDPMDLPNNVIALDLSSATELSLNYTINYSSSGNTTFIVILYYQ